jgi:hypothetical protein
LILKKMKRKKDFIMQNVGGRNLLVPIGAQVMDLNGIITLNDTAACVWELLAQDRTTDELSDAIVKSFDIDAATARADVQAFIDEITRMGLLEP